MDKFRIVIEKRKRFLMLFVVGGFVLNGALFFLDSQYSLMSDQVESGIGFLMGMFIGLIFLALFLIYEYAKVLKDDQGLKKLYIDEHDERKAMIKAKTAQGVIVSSVVLLMIAINVSIYFEPIVAITLFITFFIMSIITIVFKVYYCHKL